MTKTLHFSFVKNYPHYLRILILAGINSQIGQCAKFCGYNLLWICKKNAKPMKINPMKISKRYFYSFNQILTFMWRIYSGCYEHSKQCDRKLLYPDSLDGLPHSTSKLHLMQNNVLLLTPGHTVISSSKMLRPMGVYQQSLRICLEFSG